MLLVNAVLFEERGELPGWVRLRGPLVDEVGHGAPRRLRGEDCFDLGGKLLAPGLVDIHVHGGGGASYCDGNAEAVSRGRAFHRSQGTTSSLASLVTAPEEALLRALPALAELTASRLIAGVHLEGPFLSPRRPGAQDARALRPPDRELLDRLFRAGGESIRMVTIAPELPGAITLIREVVDRGAVAAIGHSDATFEIAQQAVEAGATIATHLWNAMRPVHHRDPGIVIAALDNEKVHCELIADGRHLHAGVVALSARAAAERIILVTDAIEAAGETDGHYRIGATEVEVRGGTAFVAGSETIAGSTTTLAAAIRFAVKEAGLSRAAALTAATRTPAKVLGLSGVGSLAPGSFADLIVLDERLEITTVIAEGRLITGKLAAGN